MNQIVKHTQPDLLAALDSCRSLSDRSKSVYKPTVNSFIKYCNSNSLQQNFDSMRDWINNTQSAKTSNTRLTVIKRAVLAAFENHPELYKQAELEFSAIKRKRVNNHLKSFQFLTSKEVEQVLRIANPKFKLIIECLFCTGFRISELVNARHENCSEITVKRVKYIAIEFIGKGQVEATLYIRKTLYKRLIKVFGNGKYLIEHHGRSYSREHLTRTISSIVEDATGKQHISAHKLRHSFAAYLRDVKKMDLKRIQKALRHANISTTADIYLHDEPDAAETDVFRSDF